MKMRRKNSRPQKPRRRYNLGVKRLHFEEFSHGLQIVSVFAENVFDLLVGRIRYCGKVTEASDIYKAVFSEHTHINRHWRTVDYASTASLTSVGIPSDLAKSFVEPSGMNPSGISLPSFITPATVSFKVPSPPTQTIKSKPAPLESVMSYAFLFFCVQQAVTLYPASQNGLSFSSYTVLPFFCGNRIYNKQKLFSFILCHNGYPCEC